MAIQRFNILITRPDDKIFGAKSVFPAERFNLHPCPTICINSVSKTQYLDAMVQQVLTCDFVIFTSQNAVLQTIDYLEHLGISLKLFDQIYVCAIGPSTAHCLCAHGITTNIIPRYYTSESLLSLFPKVKKPPLNVVFPRSNIADSVLTEKLILRGYNVVSPVLYQTDPLEKIDDAILELLHTNAVDCIALTSPSSVKALKKILGTEVFEDKIRNTAIASIGPTTSAACTELGVNVRIQPNSSTLQSLAREIIQFYEKKS